VSSSDISVVIPVHNSEETIGKCLKSLVELEGPAPEIIILDDGSTDRTSEICRSFEQIKLITLTKGGPSRARNIGIKLAEGQFIAFTDGDCIVDKRWLTELRSCFTEPDVASVGGDQMSPSDETVTGKRIQNFLKTIGFVADYVKTGLTLRETEHNPTCNAMYRKSVLEEAGCFNESLWPGEDVELDLKIRKAGHRIMFNPKAIVSHYRPKTYRAYGRMMVRYGAAQRYLVGKYGFFRPIQYEPFAAVASLVCTVGLMVLYPVLLGLLPLLLLAPTAFFHVRARDLKESLACSYLLFITLICWNWGFALGLPIHRQQHKIERNDFPDETRR
jgi:GT2 family glycosyltransferase